MIIEIEVGLIAAAALVLAAFFVPVLIQLRKTFEESERLLKNLNYELPLLLKEATGTAQTLNRVAADVRAGAEKAKILGEAIGAIGGTVNQVHGAIRTGAASLWLNATGVLSGVRAAVGVLARGVRHGHPDGHRGPEF